MDLNCLFPLKGHQKIFNSECLVFKAREVPPWTKQKEMLTVNFMIVIGFVVIKGKGLFVVGLICHYKSGICGYGYNRIRNL